MNKEAVTALVGWIIGFIITIILFIVAWNWLFAEPVNTSGGTVSRTTANSTIAADGSENNSGSSHPVWGKYTDLDMTAFKAAYRDIPNRAKDIATARGLLLETTRKEFLDQAVKDTNLYDAMNKLLLLNRMYYGENSREITAEVLKHFPELKNCSTCSGKFLVTCSKCKGSLQKKRVTLRSRSLVASTESKATCSFCKNTGVQFCPDSRNAIRKIMQDTVKRIVPYCKEKLAEVEDEIDRRKAGK